MYLVLCWAQAVNTKNLEERRDASLGPTVLVGLKVQQQSCHLTVALPAGHEEGALTRVVRCLHVSPHLQEELRHRHVTLSERGGRRVYGVE